MTFKATFKKFLETNTKDFKAFQVFLYGNFSESYNSFRGQDLSITQPFVVKVYQ